MTSARTPLTNRTRRTRTGAVVGLCALAGSTVLLASPAHAATAGTSRTTTSSKAEKVIVLLRDQHTATPASRAMIGRRRSLIGADQSRLRSDLRLLGGTVTHAYTTLNALAASVPANQVAALRADPQVSAVVPDLMWKLPTDTTRASLAAKPAADVATPPAGACPADPSKPQLEPEALEATQTDSDTAGAKTARSLGYTGTGVKVAFIADGLDPDNQDFIRSDGSHVFTDYQDFSGDGPNAPSAGGEAFGDASSIAAQGLHSYDLADYVDPSHALPTGCTIRIEGMAPGASLIGLKIFASKLETAPTSTIIQAIDYAVNTDHVDIVNESFGSNPYPDTGLDPISVLNTQAVAAGVTVVASTGDAGLGRTQGTAATDTDVIGVGASTTLRTYAQTGEAGFQLGNGTWGDDQVSGISSSGVSQTGRVPDLLAPGDLGWALCSSATTGTGDDATPVFADCSNNDGDPSPIQEFGGTSQSAPFTSGAAALVIEAYRSGHDGDSPSPKQVKQILDGTADDLGLPADVQGAGLLDTYRAVQLAKDLGSTVPAGSQVATDKQQVSVLAPAATATTQTVTLTNEGATAQKFTAALRTITHVIRSETQTVSLAPTAASTPTFVDSFGTTRAYEKVQFTVPTGSALLNASVSYAGDPGKLARLSLFDPKGTFVGYSIPQGYGNYGQLDVHDPAPGIWTALVWTIATTNGVTVPITLQTTNESATSAGTVSPASFTLPVGGSQKVTMTYQTPDQTSTANGLVLTGTGGQVTTVPIVTRVVRRVAMGRGVNITGVFQNGNGRDFGPAQTDTYLFDVPAGAKDLDVSLALRGTPPNQVAVHLSDPSGEPVSTTLSAHFKGDDTVPDKGLQIVHANPVAGRYQLTVELLTPVSGAALPQIYTGTVSLNGVTTTVSGVPNSHTQKRLQKHAYAATVVVHNTSAQAQSYYLDPRGLGSATYTLLPVGPTDTPGTVALPLQDSNDTPAWIVPTQVSQLAVSSVANRPTTFDVMALDNPTAINAPSTPDIEATVDGNDATAVHKASEVTSSLWAAFPTFIGPLTGDETGTVTMTASATARSFMTDWLSTTRDPLRSTVDASYPDAKPITIAAGGKATIHLTLYPTAAKGTSVMGRIYLNTLSPFASDGESGLGDEVAVIPYGYTVS